MREGYEKAAAALHEAKQAIAVTGAGISVESGIPDFRSPGGIWDKYPPEEFATIEAFLADPDKVWGFWKDLGESLGEVKPNPAHEALAELEQRGGLTAVITQNIDNLHEEAGSSKVIAYHGNSRRTFCMGCHKRAPLDRSNLPAEAPRCACGGVMKPDVVLFGEMMPQHALFESEALAQQAGAVIVVGTSAQVFPAAGLPYTAKKHGAFVIECNKDRTEFTDSVTDVFLQGPAGETLPRLVEALRALA